jgi:hypothetical protein
MCTATRARTRPAGMAPSAKRSGAARYVHSDACEEKARRDGTECEAERSGEVCEQRSCEVCAQLLSDDDANSSVVPEDKARSPSEPNRNPS